MGESGITTLLNFYDGEVQGLSRNSDNRAYQNPSEASIKIGNLMVQICYNVKVTARTEN